MSKLIPVGFYRELTDDPDEQSLLSSMTEVMSESRQPFEKEAANYLRSGACLGAYGGYVDDVFDPHCKTPLNPHIYTDGTYIWRLDSAHYVEKYHLKLPDAFMQHMASLDWRNPKNVAR